MRLAWKKARQQHNYDFYLWINDDTYIHINALENIFTDYFYLLNRGIVAIISGVCHDLSSGEISYGGRDKKYKLIIPNGLPQSCRYINGNFTLVSKKIFHKLAYLSNKYIHAAGDHDYGLRARKLGFKCYVSSFILAVCQYDESNVVQNCFNRDIPLRDRIKELFSVKKFNCNDTFFFIMEDSGLIKAMRFFLKSFQNTLFP
jgi:hypothetical protein